MEAGVESSYMIDWLAWEFQIYRELEDEGVGKRNATLNELNLNSLFSKGQFGQNPPANLLDPKLDPLSMRFERQVGHNLVGGFNPFEKY